MSTAHALGGLHRPALQTGQRHATNIDPVILFGQKSLSIPEDRSNSSSASNMIDRPRGNARPFQQIVDKPDIFTSINTAPSHASRDHDRTCL